MEYQERETKFLEELTALTQKYNIVIWGCGCCGSPALSDMENSQRKGAYTYDDSLEFNES